MWQRYQNGAIYLKPDVIVINCLVDAWAKAGDPQCAEKLLRDMETERYGRITPTVVSYNIVMSSWSKSARPDAGERAQALYEELEQRFRRSANRYLKPDKYTYTSVIEAWCRSPHRDEGRQMARAMFDRMLAAYNAGEGDLKPALDRCQAVMNGIYKI
jgi:pentatricopeptide repeat protein